MENKEIVGIGIIALLLLLTKKSTAQSTGTGPGPGPGTGTGTGTGTPGTINESYLGRMDLPRGIRNNNPGNFKMSSANWQQKVPQNLNTDGVFQQYYSYPYGVRMMIKELKNNYINAGFNTINTLIDRYDPGNPPAYKQKMQQFTGFTLNQTLTADKQTLKKLVQAITRYENGYTQTSQPEAVSDATFELAYSLI